MPGRGGEMSSFSGLYFGECFLLNMCRQRNNFYCSRWLNIGIRTGSSKAQFGKDILSADFAIGNNGFQGGHMKLFLLGFAAAALMLVVGPTAFAQEEDGPTPYQIYTKTIPLPAADAMRARRS